MHLPYTDFFFLCACFLCILITVLWWYLSCTFYYDGSISYLWCPSTSMSAVLMFSTRSGFSLFVRKAMLSRTLISIDATLCSASASHAHTPGPLQGPTYLPLGHSPSILVNTNNIGDAHNAWVVTLLCTLHCHLLISDLVRGVSYGISLAMPHWIWDVPSSLEAVLV